MAGGPLETGLIGGAEKREIKIVDYDTDWPKKFETADFAQYRKLGSTVKAPVEQLWREVKARPLGRRP